MGANSSCSSIRWYHDGPCDFQTNTCTESVEVTFIATDNCGSYAQTNATFTMSDTTGPTIVVEPSDFTVPCGPNTKEEVTNYLQDKGGARFVDNCTDPQSLSYSTAFHGISCGESEVVTFAASDQCGNINSASATSTIVPPY